ncbi:C4dic_mal_tran domain-containing protein [Cephalotus follicularis]|uniref:C4dic_mal_tran domain-containing protein n=1 Tax=Cephalotus follicularis TaxID=3775 RepID=A0A1Q3BQM4_CEPFO|nr:C4dic_mal_tran domain-containing protein [Cephalotus follicularis]
MVFMSQILQPTMVSPGSQSEGELVIDISTNNSTTTTTTISGTNEQQTISMIIMKRLKQSLNSSLTRFHAGYFRISLSLGGQALLWKTLLGHTVDQNTIRLVLYVIHPTALLVLWSLTLFILILLSLLYILKCLLHFALVKAEFLHHVGVNYLYIPWISWLLLLQSSPFVTPKTRSYLVLWLVFAIPVVALDVKIYGQWFTKGKRFLSSDANPTSQLSIVGNLVGAQAAAIMGWKEIAICLFSVGIAHYLVLFVTLYQRLSGGDRLPAMLRPALFSYFAAPSVASLAWESIAGTFDTSSKMLFFLSLFLLMSLVFRPALFKRSMIRFNVAWWAYSFPLTVLALASTEYAQEVRGGIAHVLMLILIIISVLVSITLAVFTGFNTRMLLPDNDPIASLQINPLPTLST